MVRWQRRNGVSERGGWIMAPRSESSCRPNRSLQQPSAPQKQQLRAVNGGRYPRHWNGKVSSGCTPMGRLVVILALLCCLGNVVIFHGAFHGSTVATFLSGSALERSMPEISTSYKLRGVLPGLSERAFLSQMAAALERRLLAQQQQLVTVLETVDEHRGLTEEEHPKFHQHYHHYHPSTPNTRLLESFQKARDRASSSSSSGRFPVGDAQACRATNFDILAVVWDDSSHDGTSSASNQYAFGNTWHRTLFLNCLKWMTVPAASCIYILLPDSQQKSLRQNESYGQRLLQWHHQPDHPVHLVFGTSFWDALSKLETIKQENETTLPEGAAAAAVLWTTANVDFRGNQAGLLEGFAQWKRQSAFLVSAAAWQFQNHGTRHDVARNNNNNSTSTISHNNVGTSVATDHDDEEKTAEILLISAAKVVHDFDDSDNKMSLQQKMPLWLDLSVATFHDWNYLGFLLHHHRVALNPLRQITTNDGNTTHWKAARFAVEAWLSLVVSSYHPGKVASSSSSNTLRMEGVRFFDERNSAANEDTNRFVSKVQPLDNRMLEILSMFGGLPTADATASVVSSRQEMTDLC